MKKLYVFADFDWLKEPRLVGELSYESLRGSDSYGFCYSNEWLKDYGSLRHNNTFLNFNYLQTWCKPRVSEYLFNIVLTVGFRTQ